MAERNYKGGIYLKKAKKHSEITRVKSQRKTEKKAGKKKKKGAATGQTNLSYPRREIN